MYSTPNRIFIVKLSEIKNHFIRKRDEAQKEIEALRKKIEIRYEYEKIEKVEYEEENYQATSIAKDIRSYEDRIQALERTHDKWKFLERHLPGDCLLDDNKFCFSYRELQELDLI